MYLVTGYKIFLTLKEVQIKMSFLLNDSSKPQEFSLKDIELFLDSKEQNWFKRAHVEKFLGKEDIWASLVKCSLGKESFQGRVLHRVGLGLKMSKTRFFNIFIKSILHSI